MTKNIEPITVLNEIATKLSVRIIGYDLNENCNAYWWLSNNTNGNLYDGNCQISQETVNNWGTDNTCIIEDVATQKGFVIVNE